MLHRLVFPFSASQTWRLASAQILNARLLFAPELFSRRAHSGLASFLRKALEQLVTGRTSCGLRCKQPSRMLNFQHLEELTCLGPTMTASWPI